MNQTLLADLAHGVVPAAIASPQLVADELVAQRLAPLVLERLIAAAVHPELVRALRPAASRSAADDLAQSAALLAVARAAGREPLLVVKGAALGPTLYGSGALRPRADVDVWLGGWDVVEALAAKLSASGWQSVHQLPGRRARHAVAMRDPRGVSVDLHAACSRRVRLATALPFSAAWSERVEFATDGCRLHTLAPWHAFILSAVHLSAHHAEQTPPLILLEDLRRLAIALAPEAWRAILDVVIEAGLASAMAGALDALRAWSASAVPSEVTEILGALPPDPSQLFARPWTAALDDLSLLPAADAREYLDELLRPPADYLYEHYGVGKNRPAALLHAYRLARGVVAHLEPRRHNRAS